MTQGQPFVHVVDDDRAIRESLRWLLEGEGFAVQTHASAEDFLASFVPERAGCAVVDLRMPGMSGLELQERMARGRLRLPIVFLTGHGDVPQAVTAMRRGAVDFVEKPFDDEYLLQAVRRALGGWEHAADDVAEGESVRALAVTLSEREREVLAGIVEGHSSKTIGTRLGIATKTVEAHRVRIMGKLRAPSLAALVRIAVRHGLLDPR